MLIELRCNKLIKEKLEFHSGVNVLIGADDGSNSIGKSSVLMLIDFAFAGDDFVKICSDVIDNVGTISIEADFIFNGIRYSFSRSTNDPKTVIYSSEKELPEKTIAEYREFLKEKYNFPEDGASFRGAVNPFFRIWGKDNYNPNKPLNSFPSEPYSSIKPNLLKLFSFYNSIKGLEKEKSTMETKKKILNGAFSEGYIKPLKKREQDRCEKRLSEIKLEIDEIKNSIKENSINAKQIINKENLQLKVKKDAFLNTLFHLKSRLNRVNDNLTYGSIANRKHFEKLEEYFPDVNSEKLAKIDQFHSGVTKILKAELRDEKGMLVEQINSMEHEITTIDRKLVESVSMLKNPSGLVDRMLSLSIEEKDLKDQIRFREIKSEVDREANELTDKIATKTIDYLSSIEETLNSKMSEYINRFYDGNPVSPTIGLSENRYEFLHNDDSGTGKAYANMIAMDLSFLERTYLPALIHDLIVFSNIEDHALEEIIAQYSLTEKQVFIAIDKLGRLKNETQKLARDNEFLALDSGKLAFGKSWKNRTQ